MKRTILLVSMSVVLLGGLAAWLLPGGSTAAVAAAPPAQPVAQPVAPPAAERSTAPGWAGPFFFLQMADTQFGMFNNDRSWEQETVNMEKAVAHANRLKPAFVVICGDLINKPADPAQEKEFLRIAALLDKSIPLHVASGNHDVENVPTPLSLAHYREVFGRDRYSFDLRGCHFIILNSTIIHRPDNVRPETEAQAAWLAADLKTPVARSAQHIVVFQHHSYFLTNVNEPDGYYVLPRAVRMTMLEQLKAAGVKWAFSGHHHRNDIGKDGDFNSITTGPVGKPNGNDPSGFRIVKVYKDRIEHQYVSLDNVPEKVALEEVKP